jgi:hypothetical protein
MRLFILSIVFFFRASLVFGQFPALTPVDPDDITSDSSLIEFYPMQKGNVWQYRVRDYQGSFGKIETTIDYGDTLMPNGKIYHRLYKGMYMSNQKYCRIDSLFQVQEYLPKLDIQYLQSLYGPQYCDSCLYQKEEVSFFHLNEVDSVFWNTCYNIGENLFLPGIKYLGEFSINIFNQAMLAKYFIQYYSISDSISDNVNEMYGNTYILVKGLGLYYAKFHDDQTMILEGAIIGNAKYGQIVGVEEAAENQPISFILYQNYPNPFNDQTVISYFLKSTVHIKLEIYNSLGQLVEKIEDGYLQGGIHEINFDGRNFTSGVYYIRLSTFNQTFTKKMVILK